MPSYNNDITTGQELNSYVGNAGLGTGEGIGYAKPDLSPLQVYALKKFDAHEKDFEQQQKDKAALQEQYNDPLLYQWLDKPLADQLDPDLDALKGLMKQNLQLQPNSEKWYQFHDLYNKLKEKNGNAKTVQTLKDKFNKDMGDSADPHEKERMKDYIGKLEKYKLGDEVPVYDKYFKYDSKHIPTGASSTGERERMGPGNTVEKVKFNIFNPMGLLKKYDELEVSDPTAVQTWKDVVHSTIETDGVPELNDAMKDVYDKGLRLNMQPLQDKYAKEFQDYKKQTPGGDFKSFMYGTGRGSELDAVYDGQAFLKTPLQYIPANTDREFPGFTYWTDPETKVKYRLNKSDKEVAAIYGATQNPPGIKEEVVGSKVSKLPAEIEKIRSDAQVNRLKQRDTSRLVTAKIAKLKEGTEQEQGFSQIWDRNPQEQTNLASFDLKKGHVVNSTIPADSSLPVYTITNGKVSQLKPIGSTPVYNKYKADGKTPDDGAKVIGYKGGKYKMRYLKDGKPIDDEMLIRQYQDNIVDYGFVPFDEFVKGALKAGALDYAVEGEGGIVDRKLAAAAQIKLSNDSRGKGEIDPFGDNGTLIPNDPGTEEEK